MPISLDAMVDSAARSIIQAVPRALQERISQQTAARAEGAPAPQPKTRPRRRGRARLANMTTWTANKRARRVPQFVIEATGGLDTKKQIVAKFGEGARFEQGKPLPPVVTVPKAALKGAAKRDGRAAPPAQPATA
jgi:hypothetical protein